MSFADRKQQLFERYVVVGDHSQSDYLGLIENIVALQKEEEKWQQALEEAYLLLEAELRENKGRPTTEIAFGTSGWRGKLGKDIYALSVAWVTEAIVQMYGEVDGNGELASLLGVKKEQEAKERGCVLGFDNRFGGELLASVVATVLVENGYRVHYAGESTTGVLSAAVLQTESAFSINLTPSHNPLQYGGYKFNAADAGPADSKVTAQITDNARRLANGSGHKNPPIRRLEDLPGLSRIDSLQTWVDLVAAGQSVHGLDRQKIINRFAQQEDMVVVVDCVHGASRLHIRQLFADADNPRLIVLRDGVDVTFGGVAPEPSTVNMQRVVELLASRPERLKLGAIIDPDGDRIRFTDGTREISMNHFGAMAYHFLHEHKGKKGMVAKTVATSNLANSLANRFGEELYEPAVGFKNFKPVIGKALVYFEESDGISIIGHTPEKDAYIGLLLALDMLVTLDCNLGEYLQKIESEYGEFYPERDGLEVPLQGAALSQKLAGLAKYTIGSSVDVGTTTRRIEEIITIDGRKIVFDDGSWLMVRPSGTEPKVRFYVESRSAMGARDLVAVAQKMLKEIGIH